MNHTKTIDQVTPRPDTADKVQPCTAAAGDDRYAVAAKALGLSTSHISPRGLDAHRAFAAEIAVGGQVLSLKGRKHPGTPPPERASRGAASTLSKASRKRLLRKLASIDHDKLKCMPLFVTLTYPGQYTDDHKQWKRHLDNICKRLQRRYPAAAIVWKLEPQQRGAPHFHLLLFNVPWVDYQWIAQGWYEVVGSNDPKHLAAGTEIRRVRSWRGVLSYAAKYVAKVHEDLPPGWENIGRIWGIRGAKNLPILIVRFVIGHHEFFSLRRQIRKLMKSRGFIVRHYNRDDGLTVYTSWQTIVLFIRSVISFSCRDPKYPATSS
jgi:hypothetical protein